MSESLQVQLATAVVSDAVRADKDLQELVDLMPLDEEAKDAIWNVLAVAYTAGMLAGIKERSP